MYRRRLHGNTDYVLWRLLSLGRQGRWPEYGDKGVRQGQIQGERSISLTPNVAMEPSCPGCPSAEPSTVWLSTTDHERANGCGASNGGGPPVPSCPIRLRIHRHSSGGSGTDRQDHDYSIIDRRAAALRPAIQEKHGRRGHKAAPQGPISRPGAARYRPPYPGSGTSTGCLHPSATERNPDDRWGPARKCRRTCPSPGKPGWHDAA